MVYEKNLLRIKSKSMSNSITSQIEPILEIENLSISFFTRLREIPAVMDFSCSMKPGEALGLVGESGCGKSTVALGIMQDLGVNGRIVEGTIKFKGQNLNDMSSSELQKIRGSEIAMIYQEPMASLNPSMRIAQQLMEVPSIHEGLSKADSYQRALEVVNDVKLPDPERILNSYPHQLSGGQQQRIVIAMALMSKPSLLILDEPTTALDVTVEAAVIELVKELGKKYGTSMLFISHNLGLVLETCDQICVMYSGEAVETGNIHEVFENMRHPYTQALFRSIPLPGADKNTRPLVAIPGNFPLPHERPNGCNFGPRCNYFENGSCDVKKIEMQNLKSDNPHGSRCLKIEKIDWDANPDLGGHNKKPELGRVVLNVENLKKYYEVSANALFAGANRKVVKANETLTFQARESETLAIVGESGCGKSTLAKVLMGLETATDGSVTLNDKNVEHIPIEKRETSTISNIQMGSYNDSIHYDKDVNVVFLKEFQNNEAGYLIDMHYNVNDTLRRAVVFIGTDEQYEKSKYFWSSDTSINITLFGSQADSSISLYAGGSNNGRGSFVSKIIKKPNLE